LTLLVQVVVKSAEGTSILRSLLPHSRQVPANICLLPSLSLPFLRGLRQRGHSTHLVLRRSHSLDLVEGRAVGVQIVRREARLESSLSRLLVCIRPERRPVARLHGSPDVAALSPFRAPKTRLFSKLAHLAYRN